MQAMSPSELPCLWACLKTKGLENPFSCTTNTDESLCIFSCGLYPLQVSSTHCFWTSRAKPKHQTMWTSYGWSLGCIGHVQPPISATVYAGAYPIIITTSIQEENRPQFKHNRQCACCNTGQRRNDNVESTTAKSITYNFVQHLTSLMFHQTFSFTSLKHSESISKISTTPA